MNTVLCRRVRRTTLRVVVSRTIDDVVHEVELHGVFHASMIDAADANGMRIPMGEMPKNFQTPFASWNLNLPVSDEIIVSNRDAG